MESINFDTLEYKEYALNGDENNTIRIAAGDYNIIERLGRAVDEIGEVQEQFSEIKAPDAGILSEIDRKAREIVNKVFDEDVCTKAFGNKNSLSTASNGKAILLNFIEALLEIVKADFGKMAETQSASVSPKAEKYISNVSSVPEISDLSNLSPEQKKAVLMQLL